jgi:hypothetical protein
MFDWKNNRVKDLILGAGADILANQNRKKKPFQLLFAWQMKWKPIEVAARTAPRSQRQKLPPNDFRKPLNRFAGIPSAISKSEPMFAH